MVGTPSASFEEEMQGKITFAGGPIGGRGTSLGTFNHENMHQWFGDNVSEAAFNLTFWKEGWATIGEYLSTARTAAIAAGGLGTPAGDAAFDTSLNSRFNTNYGTTSTTFWTTAPSNPTVGSLFTTSNTYTRPGTAYLALRRSSVSRVGSRDEADPEHLRRREHHRAQLEDAFRAPCRCRARRATRGSTSSSRSGSTRRTRAARRGNKPKITGPGLNGTGFVCATSRRRARTARTAGTRARSASLDGLHGAPPATKTGCVDETVSTDGAATRSCDVVTTTAPILDSGTVSESFKIDATAPTTTASLSPAAPDLLNNWYGSPVTVTLSPSDATSGLAATTYTIDGGPQLPYSAPFTISTEGSHTMKYWSVDNAGNVEPMNTVTVKVDLNPPSSSAQISPAIMNGWYASPTVTLTGNDGAGSGIDHISYKIDGEASWHVYSGPLSGFATGNHFVQFYATDIAGRWKRRNLIAFKADSDKPTANIARPKDGDSFKLDQVVNASYKCADKASGSGLASCVGSVPNGAPIDTSTLGEHSFTVTATDQAGNVTTTVSHYSVRYAWQGFFSPISNSSDSELNLVHAGDLIKLGFGLDGNRGATSSPPVPELGPGQLPVLDAAPGAGSGNGHEPRAQLRRRLRPLQLRLADLGSWAGTCREFQLQLKDGSLHTATFMFFA